MSSKLTAVDEKLVLGFATYGNYRSWLEDRHNGVTQHTDDEDGTTPHSDHVLQIGGGGGGRFGAAAPSPSTSEADMCLSEVVMAMCKTSQLALQRSYLPSTIKDKKKNNPTSTSKTEEKPVLPSLPALLQAKYTVNQAWQSQRSATAAMQFVVPKGKSATAAAPAPAAADQEQPQQQRSSSRNRSSSPHHSAHDPAEASTTSTMMEFSARSGAPPPQQQQKKKMPPLPSWMTTTVA